MTYRIGLLTDTHDNVVALEAALRCFAERGCSAIIHLGDICTPATLRYFENRDRNMELFWILGNEDVGDWSVSTVSGGVFVELKYGVTTVAGRKFGLCHSTYQPGDMPGGRPRLIPQWCSSGEFDYVLYGHVHYFNLKFPTELCPTVLLNPGGFYHENPLTTVILDINLRTVSLYQYMWRVGSFALVCTIDLSNRSQQKGSAWKAYSDEVIGMRKKRTNYWKENHHLCAGEEDWLKIDDLVRGEPFV
jgi:putative phosphoesterase